MHSALDDKAQADPCLRNLRQTDPRTDKARILSDKDKLLKEASDWALETQEFRDWYDRADTQLLWIKGNPGKGKTMMAIALIDELSHRIKTKPDLGVLSYFFCQNTDFRLNNAISVLRGLIYMLVIEHNTLAKPLRDEFERAGSTLFEGPDVFFELQRILLTMLKIPEHGTFYLVVDALDECGSGLSELLDLIIDNEFTTPFQVKWLITSRNYKEIEEQLRLKDSCLNVSLEINSSYVSRAVEHFVNIKIEELARKKIYTEELKKTVINHLKKNAEGTFLWVALACKMLQKILTRKVLSTLEEFPPGLDPIYERMMGQILGMEDSEDVEICKCIIVAVILARRPLHLKELGAIADPSKKLWEDLSSLEELVQLCGSFLTIREDIVYFVHQSAKDFFTTGKGQNIVPSGRQEHGKIAYRSLDLMSNTLRKDMCGLQKPGAIVAEAHKRFSRSRFTHVEYACCYWVDHLAECLTDASRDEYDRLRPFNNGEKVKMFLQGHLLHWLEVLSVSGKVSEGVLMLEHLQSLINVSLLIE